MDKTKIALITGGTGDIGTAIAKHLNGGFSKVIALDVVVDNEGEQWQADCRKAGFEQLEFMHMDVTDFNQCQEVVHTIIQQYGRIDVLVNNAGITRDAVFSKMTKEQWDQVIRVNLDGMFNVTRQVVETMSAQHFGDLLHRDQS